MSDAGDTTARGLLCCCCGAGAMTTAGGARSRAAASAAPGISCERSSFDAIWDEWEAEAARASPAAPEKPRGVMSAAALALLPSPGRRAARSSPGRGAAQAAPGEIVELVRSQTERFFEHMRSEASALRAENAQLREAAAAAAATQEALQRAPVARAHARRITAAAVAEEATVMQPRSDNAAGDLETGTPRWHDPCCGPWYDGAPLATALPPSRVIRSSAAASQGDTVSYHSGAFTAHIAGIGRRSPRPAAACDDVDAAERGSAPGSARSDVSWGGEGDVTGGDVSDGGDSARSGGAARGAAMRVCRAAAASCGASMDALSALLQLRSGDHDGDDLVTGGGDYDDYERGMITMAAAPQPQPRAWAQAARAASPVHRHGVRASLAVADDDVAGDDSCVSLASLRALRIGAVAAAEAACADAQEALRRGAPPPPRAPHAPGAAAAAEAAAEAVREASDTFAARADEAAVRYNTDHDASSATSSGVRRGALPRPAAWPFAARGIEVQAAGASEAVTQLNPSSSSAPAADVAPGLAFPRDYWDDVAAARALRALPSAVAEAEAADDDDDLDAESAPLSFAAALAAAAAAQSDATAAASAALARAAALCASSEALHAEAALDDGASSCDDAAGGPTSNASAVSAKGAVAQPVEARDADALRKAAAIMS